MVRESGRLRAVYQPRLVDGLIEQLLAELPALLVVGPRATGKTTTATRHARSIVRLDREAEAVAFRADPDAALRGLPEPVLLDEWQVVPGVLGADEDDRDGENILAEIVEGDIEGGEIVGRCFLELIDGQHEDRVGLARGEADGLEEFLEIDGEIPAVGHTSLGFDVHGEGICARRVDVHLE